MSVMPSRSAPAHRPLARPGALAALGKALNTLGLVAAVVWLVLAVIWSDHGEGGGYATPLAVGAAALSLLIGWSLRRLLAGD